MEKVVMFIEPTDSYKGETKGAVTQFGVGGKLDKTNDIN